MAAEDVQKSMENAVEGDHAPPTAAAITEEAEGQVNPLITISVEANAASRPEGGEEVLEQKSESGLGGGGVNNTLDLGSFLLEAASGGRKRKTEMEVGGSSTGGGAPKLARFAEGGEIVPKCSVCGREFGSWKAVFGHMRTHPDRDWRGVFPPPTFNPDGSPEEQQEEPWDVSKIDLNVALEPSSPPPLLPPPPPPSPERDAGGAGGLDLNFPPPEEE